MRKTKRKTKKYSYSTIGIRFASGSYTVYTYLIRRGAKVKLGDELVLDTPRGPAVGFVVRIDKTPQWRKEGYDYKYATRRTTSL